MTNLYAPNFTNKNGHTLPINGIEMYYEEFGEGNPLVLLHGFGGCTQNWQPFTEELSLHYRLIVIDLRGHGYSTNPENKFTHQAAANDVFGLLDQLNIVNFYAMGISTGGMILLHMANTQAERINAMVLISATTYFPEQARNIMRRASFNTMPSEVREMYRECAKRGDEQIEQLITQFNAFYDNYEDMNFTEAMLKKISTPTLIVHGDKDQFFPVDIAIDMYHSLPNAALWIVRGGEHVPIYNTMLPFTSIALKFLEDTNS